MSRTKDALPLDGPGVPPYLSFKTFSGFIERMRKGLPNRVDRSIMSSLSGSNQSQLLAALRYLQLISPKGVPTEKLSSLVESEGIKFRRALREILIASYPFLFKGFDLQRATIDQLIKQFANAGGSGDTVRKCVSFFLAAARQAELQVSPFMLNRIRTRRRANAGSRVSRDEDSPARAGFPSWQELALSKLPEFDPTWSPEIKRKWFDAFERLIKQTD